MNEFWVRVIEEQANSNSKVVRRVIAFLLQHITIEEGVLVGELRVSKEKIREAISGSWILTCWKQGVSRIYAFNPSFIGEVKLECVECRNRKSVTKNIPDSDKKIRIFRCKRETGTCMNTVVRESDSMAKVLYGTGFRREKYEKQFSRGKDLPQVPGDISQWQITDFYKYVNIIWEDYFPHVSKFSLGVRRRYIGLLVRQVKAAVSGDTANYMIRKAIRDEFQRCKENASLVSLKKMGGANFVREVIKEGYPQKCGEYKIFCTYAGDECSLEKFGQDCRKELRDKMEKLYN